MGCDIHPYMEIKVNNKWVFIGGVIAGRNYRMFGMLSGVRDNSIFEDGFFQKLQEIPKGVSKEMLDAGLCELNDKNGDYHSFTLVAYPMMQKFVKQMKNRRLPIYYARSWYLMMQQIIASGFAEDARVILWYDN